MFALEVGVYVAAGYWGFTLDGPLAARVAAGVGAPVLLAIGWGLLGSPRARWPLRGVARVVLEVAWFGAGALALLFSGHPFAALVFWLLFVGNAVLRALWR